MNLRLEVRVFLLMYVLKDEIQLSLLGLVQFRFVKVHETKGFWCSVRLGDFEEGIYFAYGWNILRDKSSQFSFQFKCYRFKSRRMLMDCDGC